MAAGGVNYRLKFTEQQLRDMLMAVRSWINEYTGACSPEELRRMIDSPSSFASSWPSNSRWNSTETLAAADRWVIGAASPPKAGGFMADRDINSLTTNDITQWFNQATPEQASQVLPKVLDRVPDYPPEHRDRIIQQMQSRTRKLFEAQPVS